MSRLTLLAVLAALLVTPAHAATTPQPHGPGGAWTLTFADGFNGSSLDQSRWVPHWYSEGGRMNLVPTYRRNVRVQNGALWLRLANESGAITGAAVNTRLPDGGGFAVTPGMLTEARVYYSGSTSCPVYNWPAWWISAVPWPDGGENDIAEGLQCRLTANYHSPTLGHGSGYIAGPWSNSWHTYGILRGTGRCDVYYDGRLVTSYSTADSGAGENLIFNVGLANGQAAHTGWMSGIRVDYVRAWRPA